MKIFSRFIHTMRSWFGRERRRFPRYEVKEEDELKAFFSLEGASAYIHDASVSVEQPHPIINMSKSGLSLFLVEGDSVERFRSERSVTLELCIDNQLLSVPCEVVYVLEGLRRVGLRFSRISKEQMMIIEHYLDAKFLAGSIREIPVKEQKVRGQVCRWFHGMNNTEFFSWQSGSGEVVRQLLIFINLVIEWTRERGIRTGKVYRPDFALTYTTVFSHEPNPIEYDAERDGHTIDMARSIVELARIDPKLKEHFLAQVEK